MRFYVKRTEENGITKRGVVLINETIPYPIVARLPINYTTNIYGCTNKTRDYYGEIFEKNKIRMVVKQ